MPQIEVILRESIFWIELSATIVAIITYKYYRDSANKILLLLLLLIVFVELSSKIAYLYSVNPTHTIISFLRGFLPEQLLKKNIWIGSFYSIVSFYIFLFYYKGLIKDSFFKKLFVFLIVTYSLSVLYTLLSFKQLLLNWAQFHHIVGVFATLICCFYYFKKFIENDDLEIWYKKLSFWASLGILFFNLLTMPIFIFARQLNFSQSVYTYILVISCYIMYGSFISGFIINAREARKKLSS